MSEALATRTIDAKAPLHGRVVSAAAWTGRRMIVWGGYTASRTFLDGAAFTPRTP